MYGYSQIITTLISWWLSPVRLYVQWLIYLIRDKNYLLIMLALYPDTTAKTITAKLLFLSFVDTQY